MLLGHASLCYSTSSYLKPAKAEVNITKPQGFSIPVKALLALKKKKKERIHPVDFTTTTPLQRKLPKAFDETSNKQQDVDIKYLGFVLHFEPIQRS